MATLLHEAAHAINFVRGVADCSRSQYHNKMFAAQAERLGLEANRVDHYGFASTRLRPGTGERYAAQLNLLGRVLIHRTAGVQTPTARPSRNVRAACPCGFLIRVARRTLTETTITCGTCSRPFEPKST